MNVLNEILGGLEFAFQKHEKEIVIELATDRLLHFIGVYLVVILSVLSKAMELADGNISCLPMDNSSKPSKSFLDHANHYCSESPNGSPHLKKYEGGLHSHYENNSCATFKDNIQYKMLIHDSNPVTTFIECFPYLLLSEAILLAIPSIYWHHAVGGRLIGHLVFVQSLMKDVYDSLKIIPAGIYRKLPYDKRGIYLDGWRSFKTDYKRMHQGMSSNNTDKSKKKTFKRMSILEKDLTLNEVVNLAVHGDIKEEEYENPLTCPGETEEQSKLTRRLCGSMKDRHLFSMLCYENFASLEYHPYIMSVQSLTSTPAAQGDRRGIVPLQKGIWRQFTHKDNFTGYFLITSYMAMCIFRMLLSITIFTATWILFGLSFAQTFTTKAFACDIPLHDLCLVCVIKRHWDVTALFFVNSCIILVYFILSTFQFCFVRFGSDRALCYYFEDMNDTFSVSFLSAFKARKK